MMAICKCSLQYSLHFSSADIDVGHCNSDSENMEKKRVDERPALCTLCKVH